MSAPAKSSAKLTDKQVVASRLLGGSVKRSYDPAIDIDWKAPLDPERFFLPPGMSTLYGTPLWDGMSQQQRIELTRQELANILSVGIWFENILIQGLARMILHNDPTAPHVHYALTEMGDETRHMVMFGRVIETIGAKPYPLSKPQLAVVSQMPRGLRGTMLWVAALVGEEIFDTLQREMVADPQLQPIVSQLMRIHVTEEARHIRYAREGVMRRLNEASRFDRATVARMSGLGGPLMAYAFTNPEIYRRVGLDPKVARAQALANPLHIANKKRGFASLGKFLMENGVLSPIAQRSWRRSGFLD
ncbi:para-aminobenzoate N-oxygenase AurF [Jatrophihabitans sp. GAS493]|uniref:AurF N-oxygenase family protein n=1 Tax=Jatrophihabitans sp. GAS493 TaxID=1907575 RepID=UPI000BB8A60B|nr:diiron oxygenase [Jatrophihabitans sp. GAS493]SOD70560.1 para-aminobenzoate N-oxygenase AurF [Jatrophihabitans sp. GAS493]